MRSPRSAPNCLHCGRPSPEEETLCARCVALAKVRRLYVPVPCRPPGWEARLRELTRRATLGLPLFDDPLPPV